LRGQEILMAVSIAIVTVQYNNPDDTRKLLRSVVRLGKLDDLRVVVVDNSSEKLKRISSKSLRSREFTSVEVLRPEQNLYYWGGARYALQTLWPARAALPDWVIICNNDLEFPPGDFLERIREYDGQRFPIIAPSIMGSEGDQNPLLETRPGFMSRAKWRAYDTSFVLARSLLATHSAAKRAKERFETMDIHFAWSHGNDTPRALKITATFDPESMPSARAIYAPHGACMIFSNAFFLRGGDLDTTVPMFAEELTIASQAKQLGMKVWYDPTMMVIHREHSTTGRKLTREKYEMERAARRRYYALERNRE
jgi:GT2 family glycosyltransferase